MPEGIDCSTPLTAGSAKALADAGYRFAARYLVPAAYAWKRLTPAEAHAISAAGLQLVSVFETAAKRAAAGSSAGEADGLSALSEAKAVGQPAGSAVYFAVDYDAQPGDYDEIESYLKAAAAGMPGYMAGVYGSYAVVEEMARRGACVHFWQTYAWSQGKKSGKANLYQYRNDVKIGGVTVDLNMSYGDEGWWTIKQPTAARLSAEDAQKIIAFLQAAWKAAGTRAAKEELHRLANELRMAADLPPE